jgi:hypothetical protein
METPYKTTFVANYAIEAKIIPSVIYRQTAGGIGNNDGLDVFSEVDSSSPRV